VVQSTFSLRFGMGSVSGFLAFGAGPASRPSPFCTWRPAAWPRLLACVDSWFIDLQAARGLIARRDGLRSV